MNKFIQIEISETSDPNWNNRLISSPFGTIYQSSNLSLHLKNHKIKSIFIKFFDESKNIVGQIIIGEQSRSVKKFNTKFLGKFIGIKPLLQWTYGPIIFDQDYKLEIYNLLVDFLIKQKKKISGVEHPFLSNSSYNQHNKLKIIPWSTFIIDLKKPKKLLFESISNHNGRKNIDRSIKRGVIIEEIDKNSLLEYHDLKNAMRKSAGEQEKDFKILKNWWELMTPLGYSGFLAKKNEIPVAGLLFSHVSGQIIEGGVVRSKLDYEENLYSQDLIKWKIIEWGIEHNMNYYNLAGFNPNPNNTKEEGIFKYKQKWGGNKYDYHVVQN
jgi:lipid II:glycine glycyltransferase (peptidoglycan interpeptide bridge formation enzyme)